ncbi:plasma membrane localization protein [Myotisia sp. PD_48]|nr:plasma membrane localization protein [Myotisia sp. PD_48]
MNAVRQSCRPKHQVLVLKCYPRFQKGIQNVKPNASELSYLLYYVSTRRSKLQKVGAFLEKRVARDVWRAKLGNVQVALQILTALIEKCPRDLPLYVQSVLTILDTVLHSHDISMVEETVPTFEVFCARQDSTTLAADQEFISQYREVVKKYANFASTDLSSISKTPLACPTIARWKSVGLQAIKGVVSSESLGIDSPKQLNIVIPVILQNLYSDGDTGLSPLQEKVINSEQQEREQARRRRMSIATVQTVDTIEGNIASASGSAADADKAAEIEARVLALRCLEKIFTLRSNKAQIRLATALILNFIVSRNPPRHHGENSRRHSTGNWATNLLEVIATWSPVQDRFIILITLMEVIVERPLVDDQLEPHLTLVYMMEWLLSSPINLIGLSVMDILIALLRQILLLLHLDTRPTKFESSMDPSAIANQAPSENDAVESEASGNTDPTALASPSPSSSVTDPMRGELLELLQRCIGNLATHVYYGDQISDMIKTILSRLKPSSSLIANGEPSPEAEDAEKRNTQHLEEVSSDKYFSFPAARTVALKAVKDILIVANLKHTVPGIVPDSRNRVSIQVWEGTQWLLRDSDPEVRHTYVDALLTWLKLETNESDLRASVEPLRAPKFSTKRDISEGTENLAKRVLSAANQSERSVPGDASRFLQLLHFVIFENATETTASQSDFLLLHLLLVGLVDNLGVNATKYGLPVMMKLQEFHLDKSTAVSLAAALRISSLIHGYLCAVVEKFDLEGTKVGNEIVNEIMKRKEKGVWLNSIRFPPQPPSHISSGPDPPIDDETLSKLWGNAYTPFTSLNDLVAQIESAYNSSYMSPAASPSSSPGRVFSVPVLTQSYSSGSQNKHIVGSRLPQPIKELMLSSWSREACLAALESEKAKSSSLSGSKAGTGHSTARNHLANLYKYDDASHAGTDSPMMKGRRLHERPTSATYFESRKPRQQNMTDGSHSPTTVSSRDSTLRVNELRRVLSVINNSNARQPSPLRGRPRLGSDASSTESMVTDNLSTSDIGGPTSGAATERSHLGRADFGFPNNNLDDAEDIPPVPPLPTALTIPGGFPAETPSESMASSRSHSPPGADRPATAPSRHHPQFSKRQQRSTSATVKQTRSTRSQRSKGSYHRSSSATAGGTSPRPQTSATDADDTRSDGKPERAFIPPSSRPSSRDQNWSRKSMPRSLSLGRRVDVEKLLENIGHRHEANHDTLNAVSITSNRGMLLQPSSSAYPQSAPTTVPVSPISISISHHPGHDSSGNGGKAVRDRSPAFQTRTPRRAIRAPPY